jgi:DNA repair exonuclease SbcCD ATPase subunit
MNIQFNRVELDGFMSFDRASLTISDLGIVSVKGINEYEPLATSNGSGKSALSESILWCLTGSTSRGATDVANHILNKGVYVTLDMDIDDNNYVITRAKNHCDYGSALKIVRNGEDISGNTLTKSKAILEEEFNHSLDYDTLTSIIILSQGLPGRLSTLKPSSRKSRLEELSKTDHYIDALQTKVNSAIADLNQQFTSINGQII